MTHELPEWDPPDPNEFAYTPLGDELHTELMNVRKLIRRDVATQLPEDSAAADNWWKSSDSEESTEVPTYVGRVLDAKSQVGKLLIERMCYNPKLNTHYGFDGFECVKVGTRAISFRTLAGFKVFSVSLSPDGEDVVEMVSSIGGAFAQSYFDKKAEGLDKDESDRRLFEYLHRDEAEDEQTLTLYDVLGPYSVRFVPRTIAKMREVQAWFTDCRNRGVDPFSDAAWAKDETYEFKY